MPSLAACYGGEAGFHFEALASGSSGARLVRGLNGFGCAPSLSPVAFLEALFEPQVLGHLLFRYTQCISIYIYMSMYLYLYIYI